LPPTRFLVTLYTGSRWGAGTKADVFLQLIGQNGTSDVHCLRHPQVPSFRQGSTDRFLLTTREDLGDICQSPIHLRYLRSIIIGIECALVTIPVKMLIIALFKYSQKNPTGSPPFLSGRLKNGKEPLQKRYLS
uniref:PLAT domain-containing protein n=1 Tax=Cairina moschata TaxID=8855 RepID=A0A8C3GGC4_CAIMO